jgi:hypothetical protein
MSDTFIKNKNEAYEDLVNCLKNEIAELRSELKYHIRFQMSGDGQRCGNDNCDHVRYIDDCVKSIDGSYFCSQACRDSHEIGLRAHEHYMQETRERPVEEFQLQRNAAAFDRLLLRIK